MNKFVALNKKKYGLAGSILVVGVFVIIVVFLLFSRMSSEIDLSVYSERKELLGRLTETSASVLDDNIEYGQSLANIICDTSVHDLELNPDLDDYIGLLTKRPSYSGMIFFFVDINGKYYSSDGVYGKMVDTTYYTGTSANQLSYISTLPHMDAEMGYLIFRNRLPEELKVSTEYGEATLVFCGILYDIENLNDSISQEFSGENNTFIYDDTNGVMLYKNFGIKQLIPGYNIYSKFKQCEIVYGEDPEQLADLCRNQNTVIVCLNIKGNDYYFCSAPMKSEGWSLSFIVQGQYLNDITGNSFSNVVTYIALIAAILGVAIILLVLFIFSNRLKEKNLTQIKELNDELVKATNAKTDFLSNMSHDIRTPINGIMGMTTIAKGVAGNPPKTTECLEKIDGASQHLLSLINDVLDMSRIERGKTEIASKPIDIRTVVDNCSSIVRGQMTGRKLTLLTEINCEHTHILGDDLHLRQIFINILGNSVKFTNDGGYIWFRCNELEATEDRVLLAFEIEDTGIGMKPEFLGKIFDVFTQDEGGARSNYKGTGLGMAITKQLTELMGGTILVESEVDKGSKFTVTIPFEINTQKAEEEETSVLDLNLEGVKLLLAEDNELNMDIAMELLGEVGAVITPVENGKLALDAFIDNPPGTFDAILMDVMMPVMNGLEATKAIRSLAREDAKFIPILAMTANAFESDIKATTEAGMDAHLVKPINIDEVIRTIAYHTRKH